MNDIKKQKIIKTLNKWTPKSEKTLVYIFPPQFILLTLIRARYLKAYYSKLEKLIHNPPDFTGEPIYFIFISVLLITYPSSTRKFEKDIGMTTSKYIKICTGMWLIAMLNDMLTETVVFFTHNIYAIKISFWFWAIFHLVLIFTSLCVLHIYREENKEK